jgi:hypothetical protein
MPHTVSRPWWILDNALEMKQDAGVARWEEVVSLLFALFSDELLICLRLNTGLKNCLPTNMMALLDFLRALLWLLCLFAW